MHQQPHIPSVVATVQTATSTTQTTSVSATNSLVQPSLISDQTHQSVQPLPQQGQSLAEGSNQSDYDPDLQDDDYTYTYFSDRRHETLPVVRSTRLQHKTDATALAAVQAQEWRLRDRLKTVSVSLVLCLNIGVDPPDIVKPNPCARMECWIDPFSLPTQKALEAIGRNLQQQYEVWQPRARYRLSLDPSIEETKKLCCSLRRNAKDERILFHYNGHGVPKPTPGGEIWVFNKNYTQYIPVSVYDIQTWLGSPCIFVYDCSNAGNILVAFDKFATQRDWEMMRDAKSAEAANGSAVSGTNATAENGSSGIASTETPSLTPPSPPYTPLKECIQLAACQPHEILPTSPDLPADLFTCCLTTPIEIALRWFVLHNDLGSKITSNMILKIPGKLADRRTPLGELNWIFTAITDTIAWNVLSPAMFQKLFRQDLMVAALFRNFLLADRIMRFYKCHPMSSPVLPETYRHPIWDAWDLAADQCLRQLPALLESEAAPAESTDPKSTSTTPVKKTEYKYSTFFAEQLSAFEVWLRKGPISRKPPQQLPIVLQVLLSQVHRLRALMLLSKFLDLGQWAVNLALSVGIFPYVLRLLQSPAGELKPVLVFIWAKILAVDPSCQNDLIKDNGYTYFINILSADNTNMPQISNLSEHRAMCAFILSVFCHNYRFGQQACLKTDLLQALVPHLEDKDPLLRQWACVCLSELWKGYTDAKWVAIGRKLPDMLAHMLNDQVTEVRAAAMAAVGTLFGDLEKTQPVLLIERKMAMFILKCHLDASALVRLELVVALSRFTQQYTTHFVRVAQDLLEFEKKRSAATLDERKLSGYRGPSIAPQKDAENTESGKFNLKDTLLKAGNHSSVYTIVWKALLNLSVDPAKNIAQLASQVVDKIHYQLFMTSSSDPRVLQSLLPSVSSNFSVGDSIGGAGNGLINLTGSNLSSVGLGAMSVSNAMFASNVVDSNSLTLPPPAMHGPLQPSHREFALQARQPPTPPPSIASPASSANIKSTTLGTSFSNGSGTLVQNELHSRLLQGNQLGSVNRPRPSSIAGMLPSGSTPSLQSHYNQQQLTHQNSQAIKRSTSFVTSLRNLAGLMVGSYGAQSETTPPQSTNGVSTLMRGALNQSGNVQHVGSPSLHAPSVYPTRRDPLLVGRSQRPTTSVPSFIRQSTEASHHQVSEPPGPNFTESLLAAQLQNWMLELEDMGTNPDAITVQSTFYEWSCAYFSEPQMRVPDVDDPGSVKFIERQWRRERNLKVIRETDVLYTYSSTGKFEEHIGNVQTDRPAHLSMFHSYEPLVVTADEQVISVYDWQTSTKVNTFSNDNPKGSRITSMQFINEEDVALLLAGSDDGLIRLYRKFDQPEVELVSAWRGLSDILPGSRGSGLHCKWQQSNGYLFVGGDSRVIKVWDAEEELCVQEMPTRSVSQVTGVSVDPSGIMLLVGFIDGSVKLYDRRLPPTECMIANFSESQSRVLQVAYVGYQHQEFLMGTANGDVMLWDIRQRARTLKIDAGITDVEINGFSIHEHGLLVGCGSNTQNIRVLNLMGETVGAIRYNEGFLQRQASPIHSLAFHPRRLVLAVNTATSVSFFKSNAQNFVSSF
ncbi:Target of rapamycin complex 1 subunit kog1 [Batrachochytrium dendrobatidis]